jgi:predicted transcriptional regulator
MKQSLTIRIPEELRRYLQDVSRLENKPVSDIVRECLRRYVVTHRFRQLRRKCLPFAEAEGILTDEDVFKLIS